MKEMNLARAQKNTAATGKAMNNLQKIDGANEPDLDAMSKVSGGYPLFRSFPSSEEEKKKSKRP